MHLVVLLSSQIAELFDHEFPLTELIDIISQFFLYGVIHRVKGR